MFLLAEGDMHWMGVLSILIIGALGAILQGIEMGSSEEVPRGAGGCLVLFAVFGIVSAVGIVEVLN